MTRATTASPITLVQPPAVDVVPLILRQLPAWVVWRSIGCGPRWRKLPCDPRTGRAASCADPATWAPFGDAVTAYRHGGYDGIGLQLTHPFVGVDLDGCRCPDTGHLAPWAVDVVRALNSYTEISVSGHGLHLFATGTLPAGWRRLADPGIEVYDRGRFFTVTGQHLAGTPLTVNARGDVLASWHARLNQRPMAGDTSGQRAEARGLPTRTDTPTLAETPTLSDMELLHRAMDAANGAAFERLWYGAWEDAYPSPSEADLALCGILAFWTGRDAQRIDQLFRASGLYRTKWDVKHFADGQTYGEATVALAVANAQSVWSPSFSSIRNGGGLAIGRSVTSRT